MTRAGSKWARGRAVAGVVVGLGLSFGAVLVGGLPAAAGNAPTSTGVPKAVQTDVGRARTELARMNTVLAGLERQQKDAKADLATFTKDLEDGALGGAKPDEVSAAITKAFGAHAHAYEALALQAALLHQQFVSSLAAADLTYAASESSAAR